LAFGSSLSESEESDLEDDEELLLEPELDVVALGEGETLFAFFACGTSLSESEPDPDDEDDLAGDVATATVLTFFDFGASLSELESDLEEEEPLLDDDDALRFRLLTLGFGDASLTTGAPPSSSSSSSASLSDPLDEEEEEGVAFRALGFSSATWISVSLLC